MVASPPLFTLHFKYCVRSYMYMKKRLGGGTKILPTKREGGRKETQRTYLGGVREQLEINSVFL